MIIDLQVDAIERLINLNVLASSNNEL